MNYDIWNMRCPKCGSTDRFRVQADADAYVRCNEVVGVELVEVMEEADTSCLQCGYHGIACEFCKEEVCE